MKRYLRLGGRASKPASARKHRMWKMFAALWVLLIPITGPGGGDPLIAVKGEEDE
ncbi:MAG: hypothetical protein M0036_12105 [Desulfobacteraceae bacterium]|nr:hypothetical protein [Desulfobacteraceae bacterium]